MTCTTCEEKERLRLGSIVTNEQPYPFYAKDIQVIYPDNSVKPYDLTVHHWNNWHRIFIVIPRSNTPVCQSELGAMNEWYEKLAELHAELVAVCTDRVEMILDWYKSEDSLKERKWVTLSTYEMPLKLGLMQNGLAKRATVFVTNEGEAIKQEHFENVGRNFEELYRQMKGYVSGDKCLEGWDG